MKTSGTCSLNIITLTDNRYASLGKIYIEQVDSSNLEISMYHEWENPPFDIGQLLNLCNEVFGEQNFPTTVLQKKRERWHIMAQITPIAKVQTLIVELRGNKIRVTFSPMGHSDDGIARLGGLFVSGRTYKSMTRNQIFLDGVENLFWENLDRKIAQLTLRDGRKL